MKRYICVHGHFYQPPRENPWLESVEVQDSAYPYHDWNERITAECYAPNGTSRILDTDGRIVRLVNNYGRMSFNFGPTLLAWLEKNAPDAYETIQDADRKSWERFSGHGSAIAQAYNHIILPLATRREKETQIIWGIRDFQHRFGHDPEGMWLPETAVDLEALEIMAECGIKFTILAPTQARRVREIGQAAWEDVAGGRIDPTRAYKCVLHSGRGISIFFYDGPISHAVAFEGLLDSGEALANRLMEGFSDARPHAQLVNIATDGESYGHHHRNGDMALAYAFDCIESRCLAEITTYGWYLEKHPPTHEVEIFENSSWSCIHGVERWRGDCGCNSGGYPEWNQAWRKPLREALDWLRETLEPAYESAASQLLRDPWAARDDYIEVILDRSRENVDRFLENHESHVLTESETITALRLLEMQRHSMLMYTSCGWFFDELSGIETVQVMQYAGRVLQLAKKVFGDALDPRFMQLVARAKSNIPEHRDGRAIYEKWVKPAMLDLIRVAAHYAVSSLFEDQAEISLIGPYSVESEDYLSAQAGRARLVVGRAAFVSTVTRKSATFSFSVLHLGDHNLNCGVREFQGEKRYRVLVNQMSKAFHRADFAETIRLMDKHFGISSYSLTSLFRDEQRRVLAMILQLPLAEIESACSQIHEHHAPLMRFLQGAGLPVPKPLFRATEYVLNARIREAFEEATFDLRRLAPLLEEADQFGISLDTATLEYSARRGFERLTEQFSEVPEGLDLLERLNDGATLIRSLPFEINLRRSQNICYRIMETMYASMQDRAEQGDDRSQQWVRLFGELAENLWIQVIPETGTEQHQEVENGGS